MISHIKIISDSNQIIDGNNEELMQQGDNNDDYLIKKVRVYKFCRYMASKYYLLFNMEWNMIFLIIVYLRW